MNLYLHTNLPNTHSDLWVTLEDGAGITELLRELIVYHHTTLSFAKKRKVLGTLNNFLNDSEIRTKWV